MRRRTVSDERTSRIAAELELINGQISAQCVTRDSNSGHQLIQNNWGGMLSLSPG